MTAAEDVKAEVGPRPRQLARPYLSSRTTSPTGDTEICKGATRDLDAAMAMAEHDRVFSCPKYDACLTLAALMEWQGWDCVGCSLRQGCRECGTSLTFKNRSGVCSKCLVRHRDGRKCSGCGKPVDVRCATGRCRTCRHHPEEILATA